jgi:hypothetical protein
MKTVTVLKEAIKEKTGQTFPGTDFKSLVLREFSIPCNENLKENVERLDLVRFCRS